MQEQEKQTEQIAPLDDNEQAASTEPVVAAEPTLEQQLLEAEAKVRDMQDAFLRAILHGLVRLPKGATVLDLGCGTGFDTWLMDRLGYRALGVDVSRVGIEKARQRGGGARFIIADALTAHVEIGTDWDLVYCSGFMAFPTLFPTPRSGSRSFPCGLASSAGV